MDVLAKLKSNKFLRWRVDQRSKKKALSFERNSVKVRNDWKANDTLPLLEIKPFKRTINLYKFHLDL